MYIINSVNLKLPLQFMNQILIVFNHHLLSDSCHTMQVFSDSPNYSLYSASNITVSKFGLLHKIRKVVQKCERFTFTCLSPAMNDLCPLNSIPPFPLIRSCFLNCLYLKLYQLVSLYLRTYDGPQCYTMLSSYAVKNKEVYMV